MSNHELTAAILYYEKEVGLSLQNMEVTKNKYNCNFFATQDVLSNILQKEQPNTSIGPNFSLLNGATLNHLSLQ
jgi:hypothetical protein